MLALISTIVYSAIWTQMPGEKGFKLSHQSAQQSLPMPDLAHMRG